MVIIMKHEATEIEIVNLQKKIEKRDCKVNLIYGENYNLMGIIGDSSKIDIDELEALEPVDKVIKVQQPYKLANRLFHPDNTEVIVGEKSIGGNELAMIAGPCSVESEDQIIDIAKQVKESGAGFLRGGAFKPRTSPYSFQGMKYDGLELLNLAKKETGLPIVTEIMTIEMIERFAADVDIIQVGARNMQNFELLKELGRIKTPILLKRGLSATIEELLMSAEYIMSEGNENVILCERGIRTFETYTRNTLDISAIPAIKKLSHLPVIVDPSHAAGMWWMVEPLARAAIAVGADGLMIEVHNDPANAKCDGQQSIKPSKFKELMGDLSQIAGTQKRAI
jgi:3-deoxy-7-phosphoheptulonate synthase